MIIDEEAKPQSCEAYFVPFIRDCLETKQLIESEDALSDLLLSFAERLARNAHVQTCDEDCLSEWEDALKLPSEGTTEERASRAVTKLSNDYSLNERDVLDILKKVSEGTPHEIESKHYSLSVRFFNVFGSLAKLYEAEKAVKDKIPMNILFRVYDEIGSENTFFVACGVSECETIDVLVPPPTIRFSEEPGSSMRGVSVANGISRGSIRSKHGDSEPRTVQRNQIKFKPATSPVLGNGYTSTIENGG